MFNISEFSMVCQVEFMQRNYTPCDKARTRGDYMAKIVSVKEAVDQIKDGATIMFGGFLGCGNAHRIAEALAESGKGGFTIIANDASMKEGPEGEEYYGIAKLVHNKQVKHLIASHVGTNPDVAEQMNRDEIKLTLVPQGSLAEMVRAGGTGLGGVLTPTGVGTIVENEWYVHSKVEVDGKTFLLKKPLRADVAVLSGYDVDKSGNVWYKGTSRNFNPIMAMAADTVIVEADNLVEIGAIEPENVATPSILVDFIVE